MINIFKIKINDKETSLVVSRNIKSALRYCDKYNNMFKIVIGKADGFIDDESLVRHIKEDYTPQSIFDYSIIDGGSGFA